MMLQIHTELGRTRSNSGHSVGACGAVIGSLISRTRQWTTTDDILREGRKFDENIQREYQSATFVELRVIRARSKTIDGKVKHIYKDPAFRALYANAYCLTENDDIVPERYHGTIELGKEFQGAPVEKIIESKNKENILVMCRGGVKFSFKRDRFAGLKRKLK